MNQGKQIKLLITDFDGTLVDTFEANYHAYREAFAAYDLSISEEEYRSCFGLRYDNFMQTMGVQDQEVAAGIKERKAACYPHYFDKLRINHVLLSLMKTFRASGGKIAIASTARERNLMNVLNHLGIASAFDYILAGEQVVHGKPSPEIYQKVLAHFGYTPNQALVFEDSEVGMQAAAAAGIDYIMINEKYYGD